MTKTPQDSHPRRSRSGPVLVFLAAALLGAATYPALNSSIAHAYGLLPLEAFRVERREVVALDGGDANGQAANWSMEARIGQGLSGPLANFPMPWPEVYLEQIPEEQE